MSHNNPQAGLSHLSQGCSSSKATPNRLTWSEHDPGPKWSQLVTSLGTHCISTRANHMSLTPWATPLVICLLISWRLITTGSQWVSFSYPNNPNIPRLHRTRHPWSLYPRLHRSSFLGRSGSFRRVPHETAGKIHPSVDPLLSSSDWHLKIANV